MLQNLRPIEIIALLAIIVLLFGAKKLPELAKGVGQSLKIFRKEVKDTVPQKDAVTANTAPSQIVAPTTLTSELQEIEPEVSPQSTTSPAGNTPLAATTASSSEDTRA